MKNKVSFVLFLLFFLVLEAKGQKDTLNISHCDTCHSVRRATLLSAIIPGSGQIYNHLAQQKGNKKAAWKVPLIYVSLGVASYFLISNHQEVLNLRREYRFREENPNFTNNYTAYDIQGLLTLESQNANFRDFSILGLVLIYSLQVADAAVEAHFVNFDISEDLTLAVKPWNHRMSHIGLSLSLNFR